MRDDCFEQDLLLDTIERNGLTKCLFVVLVPARSVQLLVCVQQWYFGCI
jgi:hypothetical protein